MESVRTNYATTTRAELNAREVSQTPLAPDAPPGPSPAQPPSIGGSNRQASPDTAKPDTREQLQDLLERVEDRLQPESRALSFRVNEDIDGVVVSVIDTQTDELIRQIPAETLVRIAKTLEQLDASTGNAGFLLNDKA
jgi:flagellar protein FlaG